MGLIEDLSGKAFRRIRVGITDDTTIHRLNRLYCLTFFIAITLFASAKQFVGEPISCFCPAMFKKFHVAYTNSYCWIKNTYMVPFEETLPVGHEERVEREIPYYQWVPLIFSFQALLFFIPRMWWKHWNGYSGFDLKKMLRMADDASYESPDARKERISYIADFMDKWIAVRNCITARHKTMTRLKEAIASGGFHYGNFMSVMYVITDFMYFANTLAQLFVLDAMLGNNFLEMGPDFIKLMFDGKRWEDMARFPVVTYCDFDIRQLQNLQRWTVQCSLPVNLFNEKIFVVIWFLLIGMSIVNGIHFIWDLTTLCLPFRRQEYVEKYLVLTQPRHFESMSVKRTSDIAKKFVEMYLKNDGVFVIWLVAQNTSPVLAAELVEALWLGYCEKPAIKTYLNLDDDEIQK